MRVICVSIIVLLNAVPLAFGNVMFPRADAGFSRYVGSESIRLDGTRSIGPNGFGSLTFAWRQVGGPPLVLEDAISPAPLVSGFVQTDEVQRCTFELVVNDSQGNSGADWVEVIIVPEFGAYTLELVNKAFDPDKPTFVFFSGGSTCADGGGDVIDDPMFLAHVNHIGFPQGYQPDPVSGPRTFYRYAHMMIVFLASVAPDYHQPIQTCGFSAGGMPALDVGVYMNQTYADPRYAVNRVTLLDGAFCLGRYGQPLQRIEAFTQNPVDGEQSWIDNYAAANKTYYPNVLNVSLPLSHGGGAQWYFYSLVNPDANLFNNGIVAGTYLSVLGPGRHLQLASTPGEQTYRFQWSGSETNGRMLRADAAHPARLPQPITLIGPQDGADVSSKGALLSCEESMNAQGYQLLFGRDPYHMTYLFSDTASPPDTIVKTFPFEKTWWTVRAYDQYGSMIHADPLHINAEMVMPQTIESAFTGQTYASIQQAINDAHHGDEIVVRPGACEYLENIDFKGKYLTVRSSDPLDPAVVAATVINGGRRTPAVTFSGGNKASCVLDGFTITSQTTCISCPDNARPTIRNCTIESTAATAIEFWGYEPDIIDCSIQGKVVDKALIGHWKLDETEGTTATDSAGGYHGTFHGEEEPNWQPDQGIVDGAVLLDGIDDMIGTPLILNPQDGPFSVFVWIKGGDAGKVILSQVDGANWLSADPSDGSLQTQLKSASRREGRALGSQTVITDGDWHRVGFSWDGLNRVLQVDDLVVATDTQPNLKTARGTLYIGTDKDRATATFWSGQIDDVRIYDRAVVPQGSD